MNQIRKPIPKTQKQLANEQVIPTYPQAGNPNNFIQTPQNNRALNTSQSQQSAEQDYQANEASSSVHSAGKSGWCFIGDDRGFRSCAQVGANDTCMSGDIFPSQEICMNPNLRT